MALLYIDDVVIDLTAMTGLEFDQDIDVITVHLNGTSLYINRGRESFTILQSFLNLEGQTIMFDELEHQTTNMETLANGLSKYNKGPMVMQAINDPDKYLGTLASIEKENERTQQMNFQFGAANVEVN